METEDLTYKIVLDARQKTEAVAHRGDGLAASTLPRSWRRLPAMAWRNVQQLCEGARITTGNTKPARAGASRAFLPA
jgi:hypothetical protein